MGETGQDVPRRPEVARRLGRAGVALVLLSAAAARARADGVGGYVELTAARTVTDTSTAGAVPAEQTVQSLLSRTYVTYTRRLFPNLQLFTGGLFEREAAGFEAADGGSVDTRRTRVLPFLRLTLRAAPYLAEVAYDRRQERTGVAAGASESVQEVWRATVGWFEEKRPRMRLELFRRNNFDPRRQLLDSTVDTAQFTSESRVGESFGLFYRGSIEETTDRIGGTRLRAGTNAGRATFAEQWLGRRLSLSGDVSLNRRRTQVRTTGAGELVLPVFVPGALFSLDDTPERDPLGSNPALTDGDRTTGAGVDLGLPPPGGDTRPRNLGVDLGSPAELNTLLVWIDRDLPPEIAASFSWRIYTSADNLDWILVETIPTAPFGPFENRFELRLPTVTARYVKAVVSPLAASVPGATSFPTIQVSELEAALRRRADQVEAVRTDTASLGNLSFRARLLEAAALDYELSYSVSQRRGSPALFTVSNGLSFSRTLGAIYSTSARLAREDRREREGDVVAVLYTASLTATPVPTLRHQAVLSGRREERPGGRVETSSVILSSTAELVRGVDLNLVIADSTLRRESGLVTDVRDVNLGATVVPHRALTVNAFYQDRTARSRGPGAGHELDDSRRAGELGAAWRPLPTVYVFLSRRLERTRLAADRTVDSSSISFAPFPSGSLHVTVFYTETRRSDLDSVERVFVPTVRWDITPRMYAQLSYQNSSFDTPLSRLRGGLVAASFRASF